MPVRELAQQHYTGQTPGSGGSARTQLGLFSGRGAVSKAQMRISVSDWEQERKEAVASLKTRDRRPSSKADSYKHSRKNPISSLFFFF